MPEFKLNKFLGLCTRTGRDSRPLGSLDDAENVVFNTYTGKASARTGYATDLTSAPTDVSGATALASFRYPRGTYPATEHPSSGAKDITVLCGTDGSSGKHYFVRPFWNKNNATLDSTNWVRLGESDVVAATTPFPNVVNAIEFTGLASATADYYNGWICFNSTRSEYLFVTDSHSTSNVLTFLEDVPSDWLVGDSYTLYRYFHDDPTFSPSWTDPCTVKVNANFVVGGGQGTTDGYKPVVFYPSINKTFFSGASRTPSYNQSFAAELEIKNDGSGIEPQAAAAANVTTPVDSSYLQRGFDYFVVETDDGQLGLPIFNATNYGDMSSASLDGLQTELRINFPRLDKRARYIHHFSGVAATSSGRTTLEYEEIFFIETFDLTGTGWTYQNSGTAPGYYNRTVELNGDKWASRGVALHTFLGHTEPDRATASFSYADVASGRLFVAKLYDYTASINLNDHFEFSPIASNGVFQYSKITGLADQTQSVIDAGDPAVIQAIKAWDNRLIILKNTSSFFIDITYDPTLWILNTISKQVGCDAPDSVVVTPFGIIWAKSADGVYLWRNGDPIELSRNWRTSSSILTGFRSLTTTYASSWQGWYDAYYRSYRLMYTANGTTKTTVYESFLDGQDPDLGGLPIWTKHVFANNVGHVLARSDNTVFFSTDAAASYSFSTSATDASTAITPMIDTGDYVLSERHLTRLSKWWLTNEQSGSTAGTLDVTIYVDGNSIGTYTGLTKTKTFLSAGIPIVGAFGSRIRFKFNSNASKASWATSFTLDEIGLDYEFVERGGDAETQT